MFIKNELIHSLRRVTLRKKSEIFKNFNFKIIKFHEIRDAKIVEGQKSYSQVSKCSRQ